MSNSVVGNIYQQVMNEVIDASRVDFEENGVDDGILDELKLGWQKRLTQQQLAAFPWDPKPEPAPQPVAAPVAVAPQASAEPASIVAGYTASPIHNPNGHPSIDSNDAHIKGEPGIKAESGLENPMVSNVQQRVINNLHASFGEKALPTINRFQEAMPSNNVTGQQRVVPVAQQQQQQQPDQADQYNAQQYRQQMPNQAQQQQMPEAGQRPPGSQVDGADDAGCSAVLMQQDRVGNTTELGRVEIDRIMHAQIMANAKAMEGGGLMLPLKRVPKEKGNSVSNRKASKRAGGPGLYDGGDEGDDLKSDDEEAINSDLDDPEDDLDDDDEDEDGNQVILCMYDKVQRVKNKWKCVLKDGLMNVNGKDYVFYKATGEYEW